MKKIILIVLSFYFLFAFSSFASEKYNFRINGKSHNFDNKVFSNNLVGCGDRQYQKGSRKNESILYLTGTDFKIVGGIFDCSLQNTIFVERATNLVIENVTSSRGSDNPLEIRNSYVFVRNSTFKDSVTNKCVETENGIVIFYRNTFSNCRNGHDMELTKSGYAVSVFLENRFIKIRDDGFNCHGNVFLFLKNNTFSGQAGYTFRKFGKRKTCKNVFQIPKELEDSIKANNHIDSFKIIKKIISFKKLDS